MKFNYIDSDSISKKTGVESFVNHASVGNYQFIMDDFFNVLVMVTPGSYEIFNYKEYDFMYFDNYNKIN